jgi:hypothetical protein
VPLVFASGTGARSATLTSISHLCCYLEEVVIPDISIRLGHSGGLCVLTCGRPRESWDDWVRARGESRSVTAMWDGTQALRMALWQDPESSGDEARSSSLSGEAFPA